jgi:hypothetical protein
MRTRMIHQHGTENTDGVTECLNALACSEFSELPVVALHAEFSVMRQTFGYIKLLYKHLSNNRGAGRGTLVSCHF